MNSGHIPFENCDDAALAAVIKSEEEGFDEAFETMCARYMGLISSVASKYHYCTLGYELSDFLQEGLIGLLSACKTYDENSSKTFKNYTMLCVENRFRSILRHVNKMASVPQKNIVPIDESLASVEDNTALTLEETLESKEYIKTVMRKIESTLSQLEKEVLSLYLSGYSYKQCATALMVSEKSVDNALCRIRKKLSK